MKFRVQGTKEKEKRIEKKKKTRKKRLEIENLLFSPSTFTFSCNLTLLKLT
jgi:hypothetical protein